MNCSYGPEITEEQIEEMGDCYTGFAKDLIDMIAKERKFKYKIMLANGRGSFDPATGKWTGIIKEVQDRVSNEERMIFSFWNKRRLVLPS